MSKWLEDYRAGKYEYNDLVEILSDYSKDTLGFRIRMWGKPAEEICVQLDMLDLLKDDGQCEELAQGEVLGSRWG